MPARSPPTANSGQGDQFPEFQGDALIDGLVSEGITRLELADGAVAQQDHIPLSRRIRDVEEGPDGNLYVLTDHQDGALWLDHTWNTGPGSGSGSSAHLAQPRENSNPMSGRWSLPA